MHYKKLEILNTAKDYELDQIKILGNKYKAEDIYFEVFEDKIHIFLYQLDFFSFKKDIALLTHQTHNIELLTLIFEKIESIKSYGIKNKKRVYVGYNDEKKVSDRKEKEQKRRVAFYSHNNTFSKQNNSLPKEFENKIMCDDSLTLLRKLPDNCIDLIFTSPPYNFGLDYAQTDDDHVWENYFDTLFEVFEQCIRVLKYSGRIIVNVQPLYSDYIPSHHLISNFFIEKKLIWKTEILWEKNNYSAKFSSWGSWKSPSSPYLKGTWEYLEVFCKGTLKKEGEKENIDITEDEFKKWVNAQWSIAPERNMQKFGHPAMFPEELAKRVMKLFSYKHDIILDPFNGAGTTTYVAKILDRGYLGIDISEKYCETAIQRINSMLL
ncbi:MAG: site-specific DNA-methyltransferase [Chitinophagaceae bacterium]|nr:site-specific DNA-methyltransferase [Chitinophagaceae bacterium]